MDSSNLISAEDLQASLETSDLHILDASWYLPSANRDTHAEFLQKRIPGAIFWDIDKIADLSQDLPHMLPTQKVMNQVCYQLGVSTESQIVVYDTSGLFSAARVWWTFKVYGFDRVKVLDGGLPAWLSTNGAIENGEPVTTLEAHPSEDCEILVRRNETFLASRHVLINNIESQDYLVLDARSRGRFDGTAPEPRPELRSGHMPGSYSLPFETLMADGRLKSKAELITLFAEFGLYPNSDEKQIVTSCGSGVTAAIITLALVEAGFSHHRLYDGAWCEWASAQDTTILSV